MGPAGIRCCAYTTQGATTTVYVEGPNSLDGLFVGETGGDGVLKHCVCMCAPRTGQAVKTDEMG